MGCREVKKHGGYVDAALDEERSEVVDYLMLKSEVDRKVTRVDKTTKHFISGHCFAAISVSLMLLVTGCGRSLPPFEKPLPRTQVQYVRTTAYTHSESDHLRHGRRTALGTPLRFGSISSAAADWARWPAGTVFRVMETGQLYEVDDYGWALSGTNTIDLYMPDRRSMQKWGVRRIHIQVLRWGDLERSRQVLYPRRKHRHVARMLKQMR